MLAMQQRQQRIGNRRRHQRIGTEMDAANTCRQRLQLLGLQQAIGTAFAAKAVDRTAIGTDGDHRQGGRCIEEGEMIGNDVFFLQQLQQALTEMIAGKPTEQRGLCAQPGQPDGDVEWRATRDGFQTQTTAAVSRGCEHIEKRFTTDEVHGRFLLAEIARA